MAMGQLAGMLDGLPSSRASPLPQGFSGGYKICVHHPFRCGSELARDGGGSGCGDVGRATVIASKLGSHRGSRVVTRFVSTTHSSVGASLLAMAMGQLAGMLDGLPSSRASPLPQGFSGGYKICIYHPFQCGSELARDGDGSVGGDVGWTAVFASKPAPTRVLGWIQDLCPPPIPVWERACSRWRGVRVAAMLAGRPSSRASSAPTRVLGWLQDLCLPPIPVWERACSRWRWVRLH